MVSVFMSTKKKNSFFDGNMADSTLYKILGVPRNASNTEIKKAYRRLAKECHPDKNLNSGDNGERFKEISFAHEILTNPEKRSLYDKFGLKAVQEGGGDDSHDLSFLNQFFGGHGGLHGGLFGMPGMGRRPNKKADTAYELIVTLEDLYNGKTFQIPAPRDVICTVCKGVGGKAECVRPCQQCRGTGIEVSYRQMWPGISQQIQQVCKVCRGEREVIRDKDKCGRCKGKKILEVQQNLEVHVEQGMKHSQKIRFAGRGNQGVNAEPGDFIVVVQQKQHETFERAANDLVMKLPVTITEALCGFKKVITHLDGRQVVLRSCVGEIIKPGDVKRVINEGMPVHKSPFDKGQLIIKFDLIFPENQFCDEYALKTLESLLPPRPAVAIPIGDDVEEVDMYEFNNEDERETYESDEEEVGPSNVRCAQQ